MTVIITSRNILNMNSGSDALAEHHDDNDHDRGDRPVPEPVHLGCGMRVGALAPLSLDWPQDGTLRRTEVRRARTVGRTHRRIKSLVTTALIVEHNPGLEELVEQLTGEQHVRADRRTRADCPADR